MNDIHHDNLVDKFGKERTIINKSVTPLTKKEFNKNLLGLTVFIFVGVIVIPHYLIKYKHYFIASLYCSNLDMTAAVLGFGGGPYDIWKHLYNPVDTTYYGFLSSSLINLFALIGVGIVCFLDSRLNKNIFSGLSRYIIAIVVTYLLPGNFIVYIMNTLSEYLFKINITYYLRYSLVIAFGLAVVIIIIGLERLIGGVLEIPLEEGLKILLQKGKLNKLI